MSAIAVDYDQRYRQGYMSDFADLYEACRVVSVRETLRSRRLFPAAPQVVVDIACGQGRYGPILRAAFPDCRIVGVDLSPVALRGAAQRLPDACFSVGTCEAIPLADGSADLVFSIETLEHVQDARSTVREWARVLRPGGRLLFTTPCANPLSLEWLMMRYTGGLEPSPDGIGRFRSDEPGHLRRLTSRHVEAFFAEAGLRVVQARFRTHFFTTLAHSYLRTRLARPARWLASLDWRLFRRFPNGASMLVIGEKAA